MGISESNIKNEMLLNAIELVELSRDQEDACEIIDQFNSEEQKIVPWLNEIGCLKKEVFVEPEIGALLISDSKKEKYISDILTHYPVSSGMKFETEEVGMFINHEILSILSSSQCQFFSEYHEGINTLEQLQLEYEQKKQISAIVTKKQKEIEDAKPKPVEPRFAYQAAPDINQVGRDWFDPVPDQQFNSGQGPLALGVTLVQT